jgi:pimeloyl-ACP methyl ester carboxylesterase
MSRLVTARRAVGAVLAALLLLVGASAGAAASAARPEPVEGPAIFDNTFRHGVVTIDDGFLHFVRGGTGPVLVLLHGWPETWWEWHLVMPALAQDHTVIAFDLPGLGDSSIPSSGYDKVTTARRIHQAVNRLGYRQVQVLAHDVGALVAYDWARDYPTEVSRLLVMESPLSGFGLEAAYGLSFHFLLNAAPPPIPERILDDEDVSTYLGFIFDLAHHPEAIDRQRYFDAYSSGARRTAGYNYYRAFAGDALDNQANAEAKRLTMPVLAMGAQFVFAGGVAASFRNVASDVREVIAPDSGHWIEEEAPQFLIDCAHLFFGPPSSTPPPPDLTGCAA